MSALVSRASISVLAAVAGTVFVSYCIYFDRKRRSDPEFKKKLREKRKRRTNVSKDGSTALPDLKDHEAVQQFSFVQLGEELLAQGDIEEGVEHLSNAVAVCGQPQQLLQVLQQTLPPQVFRLLLERLPVVGQRLMANAAQSGLGMAEDDVE
ncbi:mitochondrial import receptor subunit TOM20 homolog [Daphnia magna]|uniref:mitochondrial import receptor subunit TOM20 homolog n=1 Tax=Daphnia magna TaxID=35525 RepID=UPI001E1BDE89|nr:mitochondrial import receptor subunit TOM20 homolog [Daphnia magna]